MAYKNLKLLVCAALCGTVSLAGGETAPCILVDDIGSLEARMFAGAPDVRGLVQGEKSQTAISGILAFDSSGNGYVASGSCIKKIDTAGNVWVIAGMPDLCGSSDGSPNRATFGLAIDLVLVNDELIYVVDAANLTVRRLTLKDGFWFTETVAGVPGVNGHRDGPGHQALFTTPFDSITADENGIVYLLDGDWLRKYENGVVTTLNAGNGYRNGQLNESLLNRSQGRQHGMTCDGKGNLYIADKLNMAIRKVDLKNNEVSTIAGLMPGLPHTLHRDGPALDARFNGAGGPNMAFFNRVTDDLIVRSDDESSIRLIKDGWMKTFGPAPGKPRSLIGPWQYASGGLPCGIDADGNVYVMDDRTIRKIVKIGGASK